MSARTSARLAWSMWGLSLALAALSLLLLILNRARLDVHVFDYWVEDTVIAALCSTVGAVIACRRPENPIGWIFCTIGLCSGVSHFSSEYAVYTLLAAPGSFPGGRALAWVRSWIWVPYLGLFVFSGLLFPDGRLPSSRWRWIAWLSATVILTGTFVVAFSPGPVYGLRPIQNPLGIEGMKSVVDLVKVSLYALIFVAATSLFVRLHRAREIEYQQLRWVTYAAAVSVSGAILTYLISEVMNVSWVSWVSFVLAMTGIVGIPITMAVAILRYRLYDIDVIINRTLVYGALTATVVSSYVLVVGGLGTFLRGMSDLVVSLVATGMVAVLFAPLRDRLQRGINRLMYGERDDPYAVLSRLGRRLETTVAPEAALETVAEAVSQTLKLPYTAIELRHDGEFRRVSEHGAPKGDDLILPLVHQREEVGRMLVSPRAPGEKFSPQDRRLLEDLARQAGAAAYAARLTADLRRSRESLVTAREEERRRLRRDLHDGLGPTLGGLTLGLDAARSTLPQGANTTEALLRELKAQTQEAVSDIRRLVHGLRPPALDDLGLVPAIRQQAAKHGHLASDFSAGTEDIHLKSGPIFSVEAPENLPPLPAAVEVACYRITQEAITNVSRHAKANSCRISLELDETWDVLVVEVTDGGVGMPEGRRAGVGMSSMRERAEELGGTLAVEQNPEGGTRVVARLPLPKKEEQ